MVSVQVSFAVLGIMFMLFNAGSALICYECNSHNDTECSNDVLPERFKQDCAMLNQVHKYNMCRKIVQHIDFEVNGNPPDTRTIRTCGWDNSSYYGACYSRSGFGGRQEVCSCLENTCNAAPSIEGSLIPLTFAASAGFILVITRLLF